MSHVATTRQLEVLRLIADAVATGLPPTVRELGGMLGHITTNGVHDHLRALERKGLLQRTPGLARGLRITGAGREALALAPTTTCPHCGGRLGS